MENFSTFVRTLGTQFVKGKKFFTTQLGVIGILTDGTGSPGTSGKVLSSTGTGVEWITVGGGTSNVADLDDLTDVIITTASTGQLLRFNGTSWVNWTPNFLTSYGSLNDLSDAVIATPATGQLLRYNGTNWVNWTHNFLTTSSNLNDLANVSVAGPTNGQILRYNAGTSLWIADDETEPPTPTLQQVTTAGNTTTDGISAASFTATGFISGGNITGTKVTTPTVEFNGAISTNSVEQIDQGDPNPNVFYAKWNGDVQFTVNGDGYAVARTGYKVTGATGGFLKADGTIDTSTYLTSYTETQTLNAVTTLGSSTTNAISVGGLTSTSVTTPLVESSGLLIIDADTTGGLQPDQGDPAVPVLSFDWQGNTQGYIDTDGKITFNGFKTPSGTSSGFLKADGSIDTNTYLTSVAPYALDDLTDVNASNPQDGEFLKYDDITGEWINAAIPTPTLDSVTTAGNATANTIDVGGITTPYVQFEENLAPPEAHRSVNWSEDHNTLEVYYALEKHFDVGQDQMWYVKNGTEGILAKGTVVMAVGAVGNSGKIEVAPLVADGTVSGRYAVGILMDEVRAGEFGFAMTQGTIRKINTGEFAEGDTLYPDPLVDGALTNIEPSSPALKLPIAFVVTSDQNGAIAVRMTQGLDLHEVHDVQITDGVNGQLLQLQSGVWTNWTPDYLTAETDPVFTASAAGTISTTNISNWNSAYGWGDHALAGYLTTYENNYISDVRISEFVVTFTGIGNAFNGDVDFSELPFAPVTHNHAIAEITGLETALDGKQPVGNYITTETDPTVPAHVKSITETQVSDWDKAYDWGNHADAGYLTSYENNYISDVRLTESTLSFTGNSSAFTGDIDLSLLPFASSSHTHVIADVTGLQTALDGKVPTSRTITINGTALDLSADRSWTISSADGYISDVRLAETTLSFTGEGSAFTGDIDLSGLPFQPAGSYLTAEADTLATVTARGATTTGNITVNGEISLPSFIRLTNAGANNAYISESWGVNLNGASTHPIQVRSASLSVGYTLGGGTSYGSGNLFVSGNVGIGNTNPTAKLQVGPEAHPNATGIEVAAGAGGANLLARDASTHHNWLPFTDGNNYYSASGHNFRSADHGTPWVSITASDFTWSGNTVATRAWVQAQGYLTSETDSQTLEWDAPNKNLSITNGNTVTLDGLATEEFVTGQGYITGEADTLATVTARGATTSSKVFFTHNTTADPLSAVEINGGGTHTGLYINPAASSQAHIRFGTNGTLKWQIRAPFQDSADTALKFYSWVSGADKFEFQHSGNAIFNGGTVWTSANDGSGSGLDADLLDGVQLDNIVWGNARGTNDSITSDADGLDKTGYYTSSGFTTRPSGVSNWMYIEHIKLYNNNPLYQKQIGYDTYDDRMWVRTRNGGSGWTGWKQIWTSGEFENNSTNWNSAYSWGNHATAGYFKLEGTEPITIQAETVTFTGSIVVEGTITESSSIRFKENITPLDPALDKVNQLEAVSYNKIGVDDREIGLIAEDVTELFPEVVTYNDEGAPTGVQYQRLSVILLKAVQELTERVNKLENK